MKLTARGITAEAAAAAAAACLAGEAREGGCGRIFVTDCVGRDWGLADIPPSRAQDDASPGGAASPAREAEKGIGFALASPVLGCIDVDELLCLADGLLEAGAMGGAGCGVRLFASAEGWHAQAAQNLANIVGSRLGLLARALRRPEWGDAAFQEAWRAGTTTQMHPIAGDAGGTFIEVFPGRVADSLEPGEVRACAQLALAIAAQAAGQRWASAEPVDDGGNGKYAMRTWMNRAGMTGPEYSSTRARLLSRLDGDASYKGGRRPARG